MGYIASIFARKALDLSARDGPSPAWRRELIHRLGLADAQLEGDDGFISADRFFAFLEALAAESTHGREIAAKVGASMRCDDYGAFGLAFKSSLDLAGSFQRVQRYGRVVTNVANFTVAAGPHSTWLQVPASRTARLGEDMTNELAVAAAVALSREVCGADFAPKRVTFLHAAPAVARPLEAFFPCPVEFSSARNGLEIGTRGMGVKNILGDLKISEFFDDHLELALKKRLESESLGGQLQALITPALSEGAPTLAQIAPRVCMSQRTLQRRLAEEGVVFSALVEQARRELATSLLPQKDYGLAEIAFLLGYADQSTFNRAFRRWEGTTPAEFRRRVTAVGC